MKWIICALLLGSIVGCNRTLPKNEVKKVIIPAYSDTLFPFVINLLEGDLKYKGKYLSYYNFFYYLNEDSTMPRFASPQKYDKLIKMPSIFINSFHDSLDLKFGTLKRLVDSIYGKDLQQKYKQLNHKINVDAYTQFRFGSLDSIFSKEYASNIAINSFTHFSFSMPMLSEDKNFILIEVKTINYFGGYDDTYILCRKDNQWILFYHIERMIRG